MKMYMEVERNWDNHVRRSKRALIFDFSFNFSCFTDSDCLSLFRFRKSDVLRMVTAILWPEYRISSTLNRYSVTPLLASCILLRRLASPCLWRDLEFLYGKHASQLSEILWECIENFLPVREHLITGDLHIAYLAANSSRYAHAVFTKSNGLGTRIGFIDGTVLGISRPGEVDIQRVAYTGHKKEARPEVSGDLDSGRFYSSSCWTY
jgi:hypothetical protein